MVAVSKYKTLAKPHFIGNDEELLGETQENE
jgi:hypothetical protein